MTNLDSGDAPAMPAAPLVARSTIRMGATGDAVRQIQIALKVIGYTHDSIPWCALFANHCLTKVGLKGTGTLSGCPGLPGSRHSRSGWCLSM